MTVSERPSPFLLSGQPTVGKFALATVSSAPHARPENGAAQPW